VCANVCATVRHWYVWRGVRVAALKKRERGNHNSQLLPIAICVGFLNMQRWNLVWSSCNFYWRFHTHISSIWTV